MAEDKPGSELDSQFGYKRRPSRLCNLDRLFAAMEARGLGWPTLILLA